MKQRSWQPSAQDLDTSARPLHMSDTECWCSKAAAPRQAPYLRASGPAPALPNL